ncbi:MAG: hypothetical protein K2J42_05435 [Muribaculaceae bacterium]|nr:hypothetical protein [Muribaculaceae bacterium]
MNDTPLRSQKVPVYVMVLIIIAALPVVLMPFILSMSSTPLPELKKIFLWIFPFYLIVAAFLSWQCYRYERTVMSWILIVIMYLTDVSIIFLLNI